MSTESDSARIRALEKRLEESEKALERVKQAVQDLPAPTFTVEAHEHTYNACLALNLPRFRFKLAPSDYYQWNLEKRRNFLGAASIHQLCKTIVMENTWATTKDCSNKHNSRFYAVIIQYSSRLSTPTLEKFVRSLIPGASRNHYHLRSAKAADVAQLTHAIYNGVCPVGNKVDIPIILSARLLDVATGWMWVGGGHPDLKLGIPVKDFIEKTGCFVGDIAEDGMSLDEEAPSNEDSTSPAPPTAQ